jgi:hypothetical protein
MKKALLMPFWAALVLVTGCDRDNMLIKDIAGTWQVGSITYRLVSGDSLMAGPGLGTIRFDACKWQKESDNLCSGSYQFAGNNAIAFGHNATAREDVLRISLAGEPRRSDYNSVSSYYEALQAYAGGNQPLLDVQWKIERQTESELVLSGSSRVDYEEPQGIKTVGTTLKLTR